jgi:hypothetical protein
MSRVDKGFASSPSTARCRVCLRPKESEMAWASPMIVLILLVLLAASSLRILREYQRGVVFQLGRFWRVKGPGLVILVPGIQQMVKVDLRTVVFEVPTQDVISRDNVSVKVSAVVYLRVIDAEKAIIQVENYLVATSQLAQTTLRSVLGKHELDDMLAGREKLNLDIQQALDAQTNSWGVKVSNVEMKQVDLTESMIRAIAARRKQSANGAPRSSTPKASCRPRRSCTRPPRCWPRNRRPSSCVYLETLHRDRRRQEHHNVVSAADGHHHAAAQALPITWRSATEP